jgi:hypothetical protein
MPHMRQSRVMTFNCKALPMRTTILVLLLLTASLSALAEQPLETDQSCARIKDLLSASEVQSIVGKKASIRPVEVAYERECALDIDLEGVATDKGHNIGPLAVKLQQHPTFAIAKKDALKFVKNPEKLTETDRSVAAFFVFGYPYVSVVVDGAEIQVFTRRKDAMSNDQLKALGLKLHQNALASKQLAQYSQSGQEVTAYRIVSGIVALRDRCLQSDIKSSAAVKQAFNDGALKDIKLPAVNQLSAYAQAWIQKAQFDEDSSKRSEMIKSASTAEIEPECGKMAKELNEFVKMIPANIIQQFSGVK